MPTQAPSPSASLPTASPTAPVPSATLPPIEGDWFQPGWTVVVVVDATGDTIDVSASKRVRSDAYFDVAFACETSSTMRLRVVDLGISPNDPGRDVAAFEAPCSPQMRRFSGPAPDHAALLGIEGQTLSSHYWIQLAVPDADIVD